MRHVEWYFMNNILKKIIFVLAIVCSASILYANNYMTIGLDASLINTYIAEDESNNDEVKKAVNYFIDNYITFGMSDFEKEMQIIKYLVNTVSYDQNEINDNTPSLNDSYKAYGALVNHKAVCSGYAKAFDLLAKKCELSTIVVTGEAINSNAQNGPHAWNQIYLDGDWYNVDVTWEDPITNYKLGEGELFSNYINRTDEEFSINHNRETGHYCTATKYGKDLVSYYLATGVVDFNANMDAYRKILEAQIAFYAASKDEKNTKALIDKLLMVGARYSDDSNYFIGDSDDAITEYILKNLMKGNNVITIVSNPDTQNVFSIDKSNWMENNLKLDISCRMNRIYSSDGINDTRVLVFVWGA